MLRAINLFKRYPIRPQQFWRSGGAVYAVDGVSLEVGERETLGLVGESGSGKTTLGRLVLGLIAPDSGKIEFRGKDIGGKHGIGSEARREIQSVFQDPAAALDPRFTVERSILEGLKIHGLASGGRSTVAIADLLEVVGLTPDHARRLPHELSGGQRQRVCIARAIAVRPSLIVADEPLSSLDVSIQAQIVSLFRQLQDDLGISYMFISHDLRIVGEISDRVAVMYRGRLMELAPVDRLFGNPKHPYTQALLSVLPKVGESRPNRQAGIRGEVSSEVGPVTGCPFKDRCPLAFEECQSVSPAWREVEPGHWLACHLS